MGNLFGEQDAEIVEIIRALRADERRALRAVLKRLGEEESADSKDLAEALARHPHLQNFISLELPQTGEAGAPGTSQQRWPSAG